MSTVWTSRKLWTAFITMNYVLLAVVITSYLHTDTTIAQTALFAIAGAGGVNIVSQARVDRAEKESGHRTEEVTHSTTKKVQE